MIKIQFIYHEQIDFKIFEIQNLDKIPIRQFFEEELKPTFNLDKDTNEYLLFTFQPQEINDQNLIVLHLQDHELVAILEKEEYSDVYNYCDTILPSLLCSASRTSEIGINIAKQINSIREIYTRAASAENAAYMLSLIPEEAFEKEGIDRVIFLLDWFKQRYFSSDDRPIIKCHFCHEPTEYHKQTKVTLDERKRGAIYTYLFKCRGCGANTRKPHFLNAKEIDNQGYTTRSDCAFLFLSLLLSSNIDCRIVSISPKIYFLEFWSEKHKKYMHIDPFQCAYDCPLIYERAWKKKVCFAIAVGEFACTDVTPKYSSTGLKEVNSKVYSKIIKIKNLMFMTFASEEKKREINQKIQCDNESTAAPNNNVSEFENEQMKESIVN